jgi:hypothetical protein
MRRIHDHEFLLSRLVTGAAAAPLALMIAWLLVGCANMTAPFAKKQAPPPTQPSATAEKPQVPYRLTARSSGPTVEFTIVNNGDTDIPVSPRDFALIPSGTRRVVPYNPENVTIDVPDRLPARGRISGRAIFKEFPTPTGHRLVFKPDGHGTFAPIIGLF